MRPESRENDKAICDYVLGLHRERMKTFGDILLPSPQCLSAEAMRGNPPNISLNIIGQCPKLTTKLVIGQF